MAGFKIRYQDNPRGPWRDVEGEVDQIAVHLATRDEPVGRPKLGGYRGEELVLQASPRGKIEIEFTD